MDRLQCPKKGAAGNWSSSVVEHMPSMCKSLGSIPCVAKKQKQRIKEKLPEEGKKKHLILKSHLKVSVKTCSQEGTLEPGQRVQ